MSTNDRRHKPSLTKRGRLLDALLAASGTTYASLVKEAGLSRDFINRFRRHPTTHVSEDAGKKLSEYVNDNCHANVSFKTFCEPEKLFINAGTAYLLQQSNIYLDEDWIILPLAFSG